MNYGAIVCSHHAVDLERGDLSDYERFKSKVILAGRFSVFEACESMGRAKMYDRLCSDPEVEIETLAFPWTAVRAKGATVPKHEEAS